MTTFLPGRWRPQIPVLHQDSSGLRSTAPAIGSRLSLSRPWVDEGTVRTEEYRHTSLLATLREVWNLGRPFTARDAAARSFHHLLRLDTPRTPDSWPDITPLPVPSYQAQRADAFQTLGVLGRRLCHGLYEHAVHSPGLPTPPESHPDVSPGLAIDFVIEVGARLFPKLARSRGAH
jgi:phospholipase C